jgi:hypothetical protein
MGSLGKYGHLIQRIGDLGDAAHRIAPVLCDHRSYVS